MSATNELQTIDMTTSRKILGFSKDTIIYGIGDGLGKLVALVMLPILSRVFIPSEYGIIDLLTVSYTFILFISRLGISSGIQRYYYLRSEEYSKRMISSTVFFIIPIQCLLTLCLITFAIPLSNLLPDSSNKQLSIIILALCLPVEQMLNFLVLLLRLDRMPAFFSAANIARIIITPLLTYILVVPLNKGIPGVFMAKIIALALITGCLMFVLRKKFTTKINFKIFKEVFLFSFPGFPGLLIKQILPLLPRYLLALYSPMAAVGLFGIAFRVASTMKLYVTSFNRAWNPFAYSNAGSPDEKKLYEIVFKYFGASLIIFCTTLSLFAKEVITVLTPEKYHSAYTLVPGISMYFGIEGLILVLSTILYTNEKVIWTSYLNIIQIIIFFISGFILIPVYNAAGVVAAMDISMVLYFLLYLMISLKTFYFHASKAKLCALVLIASIAIIIFNAFSNLNLIALKFLFLVLLFLLTIFFIPTRTERSKLRQFIPGIS